LLPSIDTPTLVIHRRDDRVVPVAAARYVAEQLPRARFVELPGADHVWFLDGEPLARTIIEQLQQPVLSAEVTTWVAIILCVAGSATCDAGAQDTATRDVLEAHGAQSLRSSEQAWTALFNGPSAALRCARQLRERQVRAVHVRGRTASQHGGIALHVGACSTSDGVPVGDAYERVVAASRSARPGEILLTGTLRDILAGTNVPMVAHSVVAARDGVPASTTWLLSE
jgi:hypothetical protein